MTLPFISGRGNRGGSFAAGPAAPAVETAQVTRQDNLINWWKMSEGTGTTAANEGTNPSTASNFTLTNDASWGDGPHALGGVILDGTDDHLTTDTVDLALTDAFTISLWIKSNDTSATAYTNGYRGLIEYSVTTADPGFLIGFHPSNDATHMSIKVDSTVDTAWATNTPVTDVRNWSNYIFTWASGTAMKQYSQGALIGTSSVTLTGDMANMTGDVLRVGRKSDGSGTMLVEMADVRIYDVEFDQDDVDDLYNSGDGDGD